MTIRKLMWATLGALLAFVALPSAASAAPAAVTPEQCKSAGQTYFIFEYDDSDEVGIDQGCASQNDITDAQVPGLIATELHVSCSDLFVGGVGQKSDLGDPARRVVAWKIIKFKNGQLYKTCGVGTPIPAGGSIGLFAVTAAVAGAGALALGARKLRRRGAVPMTA